MAATFPRSLPPVSRATAHAGVKEASVSARVIRADGSVEELGVISSYKRGRWATFRRWLARRLGE
jgi:hypothetical protein